jgi:hypothetical protein
MVEMARKGQPSAAQPSPAYAVVLTALNPMLGFDADLHAWTATPAVAALTLVQSLSLNQRLQALG